MKVYEREREEGGGGGGGVEPKQGPQGVQPRAAIAPNTCPLASHNTNWIGYYRVSHANRTSGHKAATEIPHTTNQVCIIYALGDLVLYDL